MWADKMDDLQADIHHWERQLEYAKIEQNHLLVSNIEKILLQCKEAVNIHFLEKDKEASSTGDEMI